MIALEVGGIYRNGRGDYFVVVNASFDLWLDQYGEAYKASGQMHSHTHDSQANLIAEADVSEVCKAHNELTERNAQNQILDEATLTAMVKWLEDNQPDVFARGIWDAINAAKWRAIENAAPQDSAARTLATTK